MITSLTTAPRLAANQPTPNPGPAPAPQPAETFDLSQIDTPTEAMLMPGADLLASMVVGNFPSHNGISHLEAQGQVLDYTTKQTQTGLEIDGTINGQPFSCQSQVDQEKQQVQVNGTSPGGPIQETLEGVMGGIHLSGTIGTVAFDETFSLDPMAGFSGHVGDLNGTFGGKTLAESIQLAQDGQSLAVSGSLGDQAIARTITQGPNGTVLIEGTIGNLAVHQTITPA